MQETSYPNAGCTKGIWVRKKARKCSILEYLEQVSSSNYQLKPPSGSLEYLLLNGRAVVIFDGLDELLETRYSEVDPIVRTTRGLN